MSEPIQTSGRCYEDFEVGMVLRHSLGRTVTQTDNIWFTIIMANISPIPWIPTTRDSTSRMPISPFLSARSAIRSYMDSS